MAPSRSGETYLELRRNRNCSKRRQSNEPTFQQQSGDRSTRYHVQAKPIEATLPELYTLLTDGTIANQQPDGDEIVASMRRATFKNGLVEWNETCYCNPPLSQERATIYDRFFTGMKIHPAGIASSDGGSFWSYLASQPLQHPVPEESTFTGSMVRILGRNTV